MLGKQVSIKFLNDWTFRNNNFFHNGSGGVCLELSRGFCNTGDFNNIRFEGNSCRRNSAADGGIAFSFVGGGGGTDTECGGTVPNVTCGSAGGCTCKNNLYYDNTNSVDACTDNSGGTPVVMSGNLHAVDDPFTDASPTERDSFVLDDSGQTEAAGATRIYPSDAAGRCRTIGAGNTDIGALEFGAPEAPCP